MDAAAMHARPWLQALKPYDPGHDLPKLRQQFGDALIELGSNENSLGLNQSALVAARAALIDLHRYPDPLGAELKAAIARHHACLPANVILGNGSHEVLMQIGKAFAGPGARVVHSQYGFAVFPLAAITHGATPVAVPALPIDHPSAPRGHDLAAILREANSGAAIVFLANPNNPTGTWFDQQALEDFLHALDPNTIVVCDEAYGEYGAIGVEPAGSAVHLIQRFPNLIVSRTFSKAHGLAGLRVGYGLGQAALLRVLEKQRESFNVNHIALAAAQAAMTDVGFAERIVLQTTALRDDLTRECQVLNLRVLSSRTNFILIDFEQEAAPIEARLLAHGVVVRPMLGYGLPTCLRVTVGNARENARFIEVLSQCL